jgi:hypothetical protein
MAGPGKLAIAGHDNEGSGVWREVNLVAEVVAESEIVWCVPPESGCACHSDKRHKSLHAGLVEERISFFVMLVNSTIVGDRHNDRAAKPNGKPRFQAFDDQ